MSRRTTPSAPPDSGNKAKQTKITNFLSCVSANGEIAEPAKKKSPVSGNSVGQRPNGVNNSPVAAQKRHALTSNRHSGDGVSDKDQQQDHPHAASQPMSHNSPLPDVAVKGADRRSPLHRTPRRSVSDGKKSTTPVLPATKEHAVSSDEDDSEKNQPELKKRLSYPTTSTHVSTRGVKDVDSVKHTTKADDLSKVLNLKFYRNEIKSQPRGDYIDEIHKLWWGDYKKLERHHGFIQWLFPTRNAGVNFDAQELQTHEAEAIKNDKVTRNRVFKSYELMLDFYGMKVIDHNTGVVKRSADWEERFDNLNWSGHNNLRITRMLKSLGELGFERLKAPWIEFLMEEAFLKDTLRNCRRSCADFWIDTVADEEKKCTLKMAVKLYQERSEREDRARRRNERY